MHTPNSNDHDRHSEFPNDSREASSSRSTSLLVHPQPTSATRPSFLLRVTRKMSLLVEKSDPPSPPPDTKVAPAPPSSPDDPRVVGGNPCDDNRTMTNDASTFADQESPASPTGRGADTTPRSNSDTRPVRKASNTRPPKLRGVPLVRTFKPSLTLQNSGSVARDHLASERTFLAYIRTSLAIASTGVGASCFVSSSTRPSHEKKFRLTCF